VRRGEFLHSLRGTDFSLIPGPDSFTHIPCARITSPN
jgi:hypothetical protein